MVGYAIIRHITGVYPLVSPLFIVQSWGAHGKPFGKSICSNHHSFLSFLTQDRREVDILLFHLSHSPASDMNLLRLSVTLQFASSLSITLSNAKNVNAERNTDHHCQNQRPCITPDFWRPDRLVILQACT